MRNSSLLALPLLLLLGCKPPVPSVHYSPLENLPPKTEQRVKAGSLALWALASSNGKVTFYLLPPQRELPRRMSARLGRDGLEVETTNEMGRTLFQWTADLGTEGITKATFRETMVVEAEFPDGKRRCLSLPGLGTDSYPVLNMCYFDLPWEIGPCR